MVVSLYSPTRFIFRIFQKNWEINYSFDCSSRLNKRKMEGFIKIIATMEGLNEKKLHGERLFPITDPKLMAQKPHCAIGALTFR